jgi:galactose-1-phosphate uridylyltransferase
MVLKVLWVQEEARVIKVSIHHFPTFLPYWSSWQVEVGIKIKG